MGKISELLEVWEWYGKVMGRAPGEIPNNMGNLKNP